MKKILAMVFACLIMFTQVPAVFADSNLEPFSSESVYSGACEVVSVAARQGIIPGQKDNRVDELFLANEIPLYEVNSSNDLVNVSNLKYYPVLDQDDVAQGMIIARLESNDSVVKYEYNTMFCNEITILKESLSSVCFIFDQNDTYIYDGSKYTIIFHDDAPDMNRGFLNIMARDSNQLERAFIVADVQLELTSVVDSTISGILNVPEIMQLPEWQNGCWAAAAISAGQYLNPSVDLTITDVMEKYADGQDVAKSYLTVRDIIRDEYGQIPAAHLTDLRFTKVVEQIEEGEDNGKPIVARVAYDRLKSGHFVVVCGFDDVPSPGNCYVTVMDSLSGDYRVFPTSGWEGRTIVYYYSTSGNHAYPITIYLVMT